MPFSRSKRIWDKSFEPVKKLFVVNLILGDVKLRPRNNVTASMRKTVDIGSTPSLAANKVISRDEFAVWQNVGLKN